MKNEIVNMIEQLKEQENELSELIKNEKHEQTKAGFTGELNSTRYNRMKLEEIVKRNG